MQQSKGFGFGLMRLPVDRQNRVDAKSTAVLIDRFLARGFRYFDTGYAYHEGQSEKLVRDLLVARYPRGSFDIADKLPTYALRKHADMQRIFDEQRARTGVEYFDRYLLHAISPYSLPIADSLDAWSFLRDLKKRGDARKIGFSFHHSPAALDTILNAHPEIDFVQLQINYVDWHSESVQSKLLYETARRHQKPIVVMEPLKGGALAALGDEIGSYLRESMPGASLTALALRFVLSLPGVETVLSGVNLPERLEQNMDIAESFRPLCEVERRLLDGIVNLLQNTETVPCTACGYCKEGCPQHILIPDILATLGDYLRYRHLPLSRALHQGTILASTKAGSCTLCGNCEKFCPQGIAVRKHLREAADLFE